MRDLAGLARSVLAEAEWQTWNAPPPEGRPEDFLAVWTRKEACLKARGDGLALPLTAIGVASDAAVVEVFRPSPDPDDGTDRSFCGLRPAPGFVGALAVAGTAARIQHRELPDNHSRAGRRRPPNSLLGDERRLVLPCIVALGILA